MAPPTAAQMEAVFQLQDMFPDVDIRSLKVALFLSDYKVEDAVDYVFQEVLQPPAHAAPGPAPPTAAPPLAAPQPAATQYAAPPSPVSTPPRAEVPQAVPDWLQAPPPAARSNDPAPYPLPQPPPPSAEFLASASARPQALPQDDTAASSHAIPALRAVDDVFSSLPYTEEGVPAVYPPAVSDTPGEAPVEAQETGVASLTAAKEEAEDDDNGSTSNVEVRPHAESEGQHAAAAEVPEGADAEAAEDADSEVAEAAAAQVPEVDVAAAEEGAGEEPFVQASPPISVPAAEAPIAVPSVGPIGEQSAVDEELLETHEPVVDVAPVEDGLTSEEAVPITEYSGTDEGRVEHKASVEAESEATSAVPVPPPGSASWVMTEAEGAAVLEASPSLHGAEDGAEDVAPAGGADQDELSCSMEWVTQLGSRLDLSTFSVSSFASKLEGSSKMASDLEEGILEVERLQAMLSTAEAEERRLSEELAQQRDLEEDEKERFQYANAKARDHMDQKADHLAAEKSTLGYEARQVLGRLDSLRDTKKRLDDEVSELKAFLEARLVEVKARISATEEELAELYAAQEQRKVAEQEEAAELVRRSTVLENEAAECNKLLDFLSTSHGTIDSIAGCFSKCAEQIQSLRQSILHLPAVAGPVPASPGAFSFVAPDAALEGSALSSSFLSTREAPLSPAASALLHDEAAAAAALRADSASLTRRSMREEFPGILSSSSGSSACGTHAGAASSAASQSPSLSGSFGPEAVGPASSAGAGEDPYNRHQAVLQMLAIGGRGEAGTPLERMRGLNSSSGSARSASPSLDALFLEPQPIVSVFEADAPPMASAAAPGANSPGKDSAGKEQLEGWEVVAYPPEGHKEPSL